MPIDIDAVVRGMIRGSGAGAPSNHEELSLTSLGMVNPLNDVELQKERHKELENLIAHVNANRKAHTTNVESMNVFIEKYYTHCGDDLDF